MKQTPWSRHFERSCRHWQERLGLMDWTLRFKTAVSTEYEAIVDYGIDHRQATITAYKTGGDTGYARRIALHEMLHLALADVIAAAAARGSDEHPDVIREEHRAIERLLNAIDGVPK